MQFRTLSDEIHLTWDTYFPNWWTQITIRPSLYDWISVNGFMLSPDSLKPMASLGARYLGIINPHSWKPVAEVVEHLISGCYAAGITRASIQTPETVPVFWWGIEGIYTTLMQNSKPSEIKQTPYIFTKEFLFSSKDGSCKFHISPSNTLDINIERKNDPEVGDDAELNIKDVYTYIQENSTARKARPIARLKNPIIHGLQKWIQLLGWDGITKDNYLFNTSATSTAQLKSQMHPEFQEWWNEHLAHTIVADFFGELHTFFPHGIYAHIELKWKNNHFTRMELLYELQKALS